MLDNTIFFFRSFVFDLDGSLSCFNFSLILKLCMQVAPMEAVPTRVQKGKTFGEVFFREATASCPNSVGLRSLPSVSNIWVFTIQKKLHKIPEIRLFFHFFGFKTMLMISPFAGNAFSGNMLVKCICVILTYLSTKRQGSIQMSLLSKLCMMVETKA